MSMMNGRSNDEIVEIVIELLEKDGLDTTSLDIISFHLRSIASAANEVETLRCHNADLKSELNQLDDQ